MGARQCNGVGESYVYSKDPSDEYPSPLREREKYFLYYRFLVRKLEEKDYGDRFFVALCVT